METIFIQYNKEDQIVSQTGLPMPRQDADGNCIGQEPFPILSKAPSQKEKKTMWVDGAREIYQIEKPSDWDKTEREKKAAIKYIQDSYKRKIMDAMINPDVVDPILYRNQAMLDMESEIENL